jgi:hypothetical protein
VVFAAATPISVPEAAKLRLTMHQDAQSTGITAQVIRRARYFASYDAGWAELVASQRDRRDRLAALTEERKAIPSVSVPVLREQHASQRRESRVFLRGNFLSPGEAVQTGVPALLGDAPVSNRLEFARWLASPEHPLTARSAVNRLWEQLFGRGLVETVEDFGGAGAAPSHPELLDWLAIRFSRGLGWSQKRFLRELVLSATYRQDAALSQALRERDPRNELYARGPRKRLSAEMIRDQALAASGLLCLRLGGPPVMPLQPEGVWRTVYNNSQWETSPGDDAHRRSLYTFIRRTSGYPSYQIFDAPTREFCTVRRTATNTPLQALVTLNDPVYMEAAANLSARMIQSSERTEERIALGYETVTGQLVSKRALEVLTELFQSNRARGMTDEMAMTAVANAILNLDAALTR